MESVNLTGGRRLSEGRTTLEKLSGIREDCGTDFLRVVVQSDTRISGLSQQVSELMPNALEIRQEVRDVRVETPVKQDPGTVKPVELFARYVSEQKGTTASPGMLAKFEELYNEARYAAD